MQLPRSTATNAALRRFLADAFGVPLHRVSIVQGERSRRKRVRIEAPAARPDRDWSLLNA